jgi:hypothetical protein
MLTTLIWCGQEHHSGDEAELPDDLARKYIAAGSAEHITPPVETAALRTTPAKGKHDVRIQTARTQPRVDR